MEDNYYAWIGSVQKKRGQKYHATIVLIALLPFFNQQPSKRKNYCTRCCRSFRSLKPVSKTAAHAKPPTQTLTTVRICCALKRKHRKTSLQVIKGWNGWIKVWLVVDNQGWKTIRMSFLVDFYEKDTTGVKVFWSFWRLGKKRVLLTTFKIAYEICRRRKLGEENMKFDWLPIIRCKEGIHLLQLSLKNWEPINQSIINFDWCSSITIIINCNHVDRFD